MATRFLPTKRGSLAVAADAADGITAPTPVPATAPTAAVAALRRRKSRRAIWSAIWLPPNPFSVVASAPSPPTRLLTQVRGKLGSCQERFATRQPGPATAGTP